MTAHLRMNAIYWGLTSLCIMNQKDALDRDEMIDFVMSCWDEEAGLSPRSDLSILANWATRAQADLGPIRITTRMYTRR